MTSLAFLHCLPDCFRTDCKSLLISIKDLHGLPPAYMSHLLLPYEPVCILKAMGRVFRSLAENDKRAFEIVVFLTTRETGREEKSTEDFCPWNNVVIAVDVAELCV